jgi:aryl carrier-like protein
MHHDESFSFIGRTDDQIKLRGQRLEIDEINHVIKAASGAIREVATMVLKNSNLPGEQLVSFLSVSRPSDRANPCEVDSTPESSAIIATVRRNCQSRLPGYMIPTNVIPLTAFPLSPNNKIDNRKLKELYSSITPDVLQALFSASMGDPQQMTPEMERIIHVLAAVTGCEEQSIFPGSNVFMLGLDSISCISFAHALKDAGFGAAQPSLVMKSKPPTVLPILRCEERF